MCDGKTFPTHEHAPQQLLRAESNTKQDVLWGLGISLDVGALSLARAPAKLLGTHRDAALLSRWHHDDLRRNHKNSPKAGPQRPFSMLRWLPESLVGCVVWGGVV